MIRIENRIVPISPQRERFFKCSGTMLLPTPSAVLEVLQELPKGKLVTTDALRAELAKRHGADVTCPATTGQALRFLSRTVADGPYWQVIKKDGSLIGNLVGGATAQAEVLKAAGFTVDTTGKTPKVQDFRQSLVQFSQR